MTTPGARRAMERVTAAIKVCPIFHFNLLRPQFLDVRSHASRYTAQSENCGRGKAGWFSTPLPFLQHSRNRAFL